MKIAILGGGSWGTALAVHLAAKKYPIRIWEFMEEQARVMQQTRECPLLPGIHLPENIFVSSQMSDVIPRSTVIFVIVPSDKVESTLATAAPYIKKQSMVICSKGFASNLRLLHEVVAAKVKGKVYCLYGPTHAEEVSRGILSGIVLAGKKNRKLYELINSPRLHVETTTDIVGVQVCATLKNILAVFFGVLDGAGYGDNTKAYVFTKGIEEIKQIGVAWGAKERTFYGLAGIGDTFVTCTSIHSRNRFVGQEIGKGRQLPEILAEMKMVAEGITALQQLPVLIQRFGLSLPVMQGLYSIVYEQKEIQAVLEKL